MAFEVWGGLVEEPGEHYTMSFPPRKKGMKRKREKKTDILLTFLSSIPLSLPALPLPPLSSNLRQPILILVQPVLRPLLLPTLLIQLALHAQLSRPGRSLKIQMMTLYRAVLQMTVRPFRKIQRAVVVMI